MVTRTARKAAAPARSTRSNSRTAAKPTAKKAAAPARRTRTAPAKPTQEVEEKPVVSKGAQGATLAAAITVTAHDVLRAKLTYEHLYARYWEQYGEEVAEIKARGKEVLAELDGPGRVGRPPKEAPITKGKKSDPIIGETYDYEEIKAYPLVKLRELARDLAEQDIIEETVKKTVILDQMEAAGLFRESDDETPAQGDAVDDEDDAEEGEEGGEDFEDEDDADDEGPDEADDDDDAEDDGEDITADDLKEMNLKELQDVAEENGITWKGKKQAALLKELLAAVEPEEEDEEEEPEDEADEDDGDALTEEQILSMSNKELRVIMAQLVAAGEDEPPLKVKKDTEALANWVIEHLDEEDED